MHRFQEHNFYLIIQIGFIRKYNKGADVGYILVEYLATSPLILAQVMSFNSNDL